MIELDEANIKNMLYQLIARWDQSRSQLIYEFDQVKIRCLPSYVNLTLFWTRIY